VLCYLGQKGDGSTVISLLPPGARLFRVGQTHFPAGRFFSLIKDIMDKTEQQALQVTKEIMVKFIEVGRISPTNFPEHFATIYEEVLQTVINKRDDSNTIAPRCVEQEK
jgi:hypothetical protein